MIVSRLVPLFSASARQASSTCLGGAPSSLGGVNPAVSSAETNGFESLLSLGSGWLILMLHAPTDSGLQESER